MARNKWCPLCSSKLVEQDYNPGFKLFVKAEYPDGKSEDYYDGPVIQFICLNGHSVYLDKDDIV